MRSLSRRRSALLVVNLLAAFAPACPINIRDERVRVENPPLPQMVAAVAAIESVDANPPASPVESPRLEEAVADLLGQIDHYQWAVGDTPVPLESVTALAAMNYTHSLLNSLQYGHLRRKEPARLPATPEQCLEQRAGICGNQAATFLAIVRRLGLRARSVDFYGNTRAGTTFSHIAAEVFADGQWRYFDVTWDAAFVRDRDGSQASESDILSIAETLRLEEPTRHLWANQSGLRAFLFRRVGLDQFHYLHDVRSVLLGKTGTIRMTAQTEGNDLVYLPRDLPNYLGAIADHEDGPLGDLRLALTDCPSDARCLRIEGGYTSLKPATLRIVRGTAQLDVPLTPQERGPIIVSLKELTSDCDAPPLTLELVPEEPDQIAYITFARIVVE